MVLRPSDEYGGYTMDNYPQNGGGGHHFYESIKTELESFRLRGADGDFSPSVAASSEALLSDDTSSIASKKRIDSMFKTTASVTGDTKRTFRYHVGRQTKSLQADDNDHYNGGTGGGYFDYGYAADTNDRNNNNNKNTVQEKIEKMFAEISSSELDTDVSMDSAAPGADTGSNKFHVHYIGCAGLSGKISSLEGLQQPVRDMYFGYRENQHHYRGGYYHDDDEDVRTATRRDFSGLLEISAAGLTIRYRNGLGDVEQRTNAFPSIAVWAALKYVCRRRSPTPQRRIAGEAAAGGVGGYEYAFLPLIADPDGSDKAALFRDMDPGDRARLDAAGDHAPVFAVVTRAAGKRLECHGFACETENDALLMAANLYGALVAAMSSTAAVEADVPTADDGAGRLTAEPQARRVIRQRNGFTSMSSTAGSSVAGGGVAEEAPALPPPRPPRRNKKSTASSVTSATSIGDDVGVSSAITSVPADGDDGGRGGVCSGAKTFQLTVRQAPSLQRGVCNSSSVAGSAAADVQNRNARQQRSDAGCGDILTKVAIPRSRSFLNSNGLASTKYSRRAAGCGIETAAADRRRRRSNGSGVMGFSEMFNEFRAQEGLNNMDDILNAIINVEGMSYNDLKPIYKEFLMKLALTLTKDELYQRTKAIMTEQKRKRNNKRRPAVATQAAGRGRRLNDKLRDAFDLRAAKSRISAVLLPDFCKRKTGRNRAKQKQHLLQRHHQQQRRRRCSCIAGSSAEVRPAVDRKPERKFQRRAVAGKRSAAVASASKGRLQTSGTSSSPVCSTSDDSDFFAAVALRQRQRQHQQLQQQLPKQPPPLVYKKPSKKRSDGGRGTATASEGSCLHRASSGYFSCSECSAGDAADDDGGGACSYCDGGAAEPTASLVSCSCDSDSCADSDKCYCGKPRRPRNIFDELKSRGFAASESSVSRADSPGTAWKKNELLMLLQQRHDESSPAATGGGGVVRCGIEPSKSIEYLQMTRRAACPGAADLLTAGRAGAVGSSSSPSSSLSAATVYSSSSAVHKRRPQPSRGAKHHHRRSGSSGSDNFRAIDYALFAATGDAAGQRKPRGSCGIRQNHRRPDCAPSADGRRRAAAGSSVANRRSYSSEAVHMMTGCRVQYGGHARQPALVQQTKPAARRHSVHDGGVDDVLSSFFKSGIENSLGYYP